MDNNELDKILKDKLKDKIVPSTEFQEKIEKVVEKQKKIKSSQEKNSPSKKSTTKWKKKVTSIAAMFIIAIIAGVLISNNITNLREKTVIATITAVEPTKMENGKLANDSEFIIYTEGNNLTKESIQKSIFVEPALDYTIEKTKNSNEYKLTFKQNIPDNTIVKLQYVKNQITENSWAYQTSNKLSVTKTFPDNNNTTVSANSVIEIELSYANVENFERNVSITPEVKGTWEHNGKIWRFKPLTRLEPNTNYVVKISNNITAGELTMDEDYVLQFSTFEYGQQEKYYIRTTSIDEIATYKSEEQVQIYYKYYGENNKVAKVQISKFDSADDFINYLKNKTYENAVYQDDYGFENISMSNNSYCLRLNKTILNGYYVASVQTANGKELFNTPIQINDLSVYAMESERDVLAWVASDGKLAENITVEYLGKQAKTNKQGIASFKNITDGSNTMKYMKVGNTENKLVVGVYNFDTSIYPNGYIYTDRPLYKNTDTINIWGFVPLKQFYDKVEDDFYIELNNEGKQKVKVGKDGNLNYKIELKNHVDNEYATIVLYYKNTSIAVRNIKIENYELQNYNYEIILDRNYAYIGETFGFDVKVTHITGIPVVNKAVVAKFDGSDTYKETTNEQGIAHFSINIETDDSNTYSDTTLRSREISICNGDAEEYTNAETYKALYIFNRNTYTNIEKKEKYEVTLNKLYKDKPIIADEISDIFDGVYDTSVEINLIENVNTKIISGYVYNEYTKQNDPQYSYENSENIIKITDMSTKNGKIEIDTATLPFKENTKDVSYNYDLEFVYQDRDGKEVRDIAYYVRNYDENYGEVGWNSIFDEGEYNTDFPNVDYSHISINEEEYYMYRYILNRDTTTFSIGDTVNFKLQESTANGLKDIQNEGKILKIVFKEDISKTEVIDTNDFGYTFNDKDFPGCKITSAYFKDGKFYRMPVYYFDFNEEDRKAEIDIVADKDQYKPGDEVTLKINTTSNGKGIKTFVNISVANEAVFNIQGDNTNLTETCYLTKPYATYTYSSYTDYLNVIEGGGKGGGDGEVRTDFGDTAYFETVYTDSNGKATVKFKLPDNVTTYRVTAQCANEDCYLGVGTIDITSTLNFFIQSTQPRKVKTTDDLVLNATCVSNNTFNVDFEFTIKELDKTITTSSNTNSLATANFGKLKAGKYTAIVRGKHEKQEDVIEYQIEIVESAQEIQNKNTININKVNAQINPTKNPIVIEIYNKKMAQYLEYIDFIETTINDRLDVKIAYNEIQNLKNKYYGTEKPINTIDLSRYRGERLQKNLESGSEDLLLTALVRYYVKQYSDIEIISLDPNDNLFEYYLYLASNNEPVLLDLLHLKEENDIDKYNKLLLTLSLEFVGDFQNARELYNSLNLSNEEKEEYSSLIAIIDTFINKKQAIEEINQLIKNNPSDEYLRFAILSFFQNNSQDIEKKENVKITSKNLNESIDINGMEIKTYTIYNEDLDTIKFETSSNNLMINYYYQTSLDEIEDDKISRDINIKFDGDLKKNNAVKLIVDFKNTEEGEVKIALPNSLRLAEQYNNWNYGNKYYLQNNNIDYITFYKMKGCKRIEVPLLVTSIGNYTFENIVCLKDGVYHISNSLEFEVKK